jgi:protein phosphatase
MEKELRPTRVPQLEPPSSRTFGDRRSRLVLDAAGISHPGRRRLNQDQFLIADLAAARERESADARSNGERADGAESLLVVADGMGGHPCGEVASLLAVRVVVHELMRSPDDPNPLHRLEHAMHIGDEALHRAGHRRNDLHNMGTTLTAAWWVAPMLYFEHVGHSRLYLLRAGRLSRLTRDHTLAVGMLEAGFERVNMRRFEHVLTQALGGDHEGVDPEGGCRRLAEGDILLLCTDGLVQGLDDQDLTRLLEAAPSAHEAAAALIEAALSTDDHDNLTALVARVEAPSGRNVRGRASD